MLLSQVLKQFTYTIHMLPKHMLKQAEDTKKWTQQFHLKLRLYNELLLQANLLNCLGVFQQDSKGQIEDAN